MKRNSEATLRLVAELADTGITVTGREIESWSHEKLLYQDGTDHDKALAHVAELRSVHRPGPEASDRTALILAARGFGCERLPKAIERCGIPTEALDLESVFKVLVKNEDGSMPEEVVKKAQAILDEPEPGTKEELIADMVPEFQSLQTSILSDSGNNLGARLQLAFQNGLMSQTTESLKTAPIIDDLTESYETPEQVIHTALTDGVSIALGHHPTDSKAHDRMFPVNDAMAIALAKLAPASDPPSIDDLVNAAVIALEILRAMPGVASFPGLEGDRLDQLATLSAPVFVHLYAAESTVRKAIADI